MDERELLYEAVKQMGVTLDARQAGQFMEYKSLLKEWNEKMNLTAITDDRDIILKHFADSLSILQFMRQDENTRIIDVGTGAGFPAVPLKIAFPGAEVTLLDSLNKRLVFLDCVIETLGLTGVSRIHGRAEECGRQKELRGQFDYAVSRAVGRLSLLAEYCLPFVKTGGCFLAMKGGDIAGEAGEAEAAVSALGGRIEAVEHIVLPFTDITHSVIIIKKYRQTPPVYPRKQAQISKNPIK